MSEPVATSEFFWTTLAVFLTLATFSFVYRDNPLYKIAESLVVGVSAGYFVVLLYYNTLVPQLFDKIKGDEVHGGNMWYYLPMFLGALMWTRFYKKTSWVSRYPIAITIGVSTGLAIPLEMQTRVNEQLVAMMKSYSWDNFFGLGALDFTSSFSQLLILIGTLSAVIYFFFSKAHTGWFGGVAKVGIWTLMLGFGASFGFTVMARISLLINRVQFLEGWRSSAFGENGSGLFAAICLLVFLFFLVVLLFDIIRTKGRAI